MQESTVNSEQHSSTLPNESARDFSHHMPEENPYKSYQESIDKSLQQKQAAELLKIQRLCYEVFAISSQGIELYKALEDKFLLQSLWNPLTEHAERVALYWEGFRDCIRSFKQMCEMHKKMEQSPKENTNV